MHSPRPCRGPRHRGLPATMSFAAAAVASRRAHASSGSRGIGSTGGSSSSTEPTAPALLTMVVVSTGLICAGIWYLASSALGAREQLEQEYLQSVERWTSQSREEFRKLAITAGTRYHQVSLKTDTTVDQLHDDENAAAVPLPHYESLSYLVRGVPRDFLPDADFASLHEHVDDAEHSNSGPSSKLHRIGKQEWGPAVSFSLKLEDESFGISHLETGIYPLLRSIARHAPTPAPELKCQRELQGRFDHGLCWVYSKLVGICVQVRKNPSSHRWQFAEGVPGLNESYGCDYSHGGWVASRYERVHAKHATGFVSFENFTIQVRSAEDPYLQALNLTSGVLDFGMSAQDDRTIGLVMLILGVVVACPPCFQLCKSQQESYRDAREFAPRQWHRQQDQDQEMFGVAGYQGFESDSNEVRMR